MEERLARTKDDKKEDENAAIFHTSSSSTLVRLYRKFFQCNDDIQTYCCRQATGK
jgi:hypothetical protein